MPNDKSDDHQLERILSTEFVIAAERLREAASDSAKVARSTRARTRRNRITMQSQTSLPAVKPQPAKIEMPEAWRGDEETRKIKTR